MTNRKKKQDPKKDVPGKKLAVVKKVKTATRRSSRIMERRLKSNMSVIEKLPERVYEVQAQKKQHPENEIAMAMKESNSKSIENLKPMTEVPDLNLETSEVFSSSQQELGMNATSSAAFNIEKGKRRSREESSNVEQASIEPASKKFCQEDEIDLGMTGSSVEIDCSKIYIDTVECDDMADMTAEPEDIEKNDNEKIYCATCKRKLGLTAIQCRCGGFFCAKHRYSNKHDCTFDYRELGREEIIRNNPLLKNDKIKKI